MPKVYVCAKIPDDGLTLLRQKGFTVEVNESANNLTREELKKTLGRFDAVITLVTDMVDDEVLSAASSTLKIVSNYGVGFDNIDIVSASRRGITITNTPGVANESVAEHTIMLMLACAKQIIAADKYVRVGNYTKWDPYLFVSPRVLGKTIGIVGLGNIGSFVGQIAKNGLRMEIIYFDTSRSEDFELLCEAKFVDLDTLFSEADFITLHCPLNKKTHHLVGLDQINKMKKSAVLINTSRGAIVDEESLIRALKEKRIAAAGLDVFEHEPNVNRELLALSNVVLTPHVSSATIETRVAMSKIAAQNIIDVFEGKKPFGLIKA